MNLHFLCLDNVGDVTFFDTSFCTDASHECKISFVRQQNFRGVGSTSTWDLGRERMHSFHMGKMMLKALDQSLCDKSAIMMTNCKVQSQKGDDTIVINEHTEVEMSPKKFVIPDSHTNACDAVEICDLSPLANNTTVNTTEIAEQETVTAEAGKSYIKQV